MQRKPYSHKGSFMIFDLITGKTAFRQALKLAPKKFSTTKRSLE
ncbi:hypothetical protein A343_0585 [Porphyromonas gingivalis JCVI SC001]|nr:hypothetical protein A343_0585 [Porphyromonas gingivalis JCVI SC001]